MMMMTMMASILAGRGRLALLTLTGTVLASASIAVADPVDIGLVENVVVVGRHVPTINFRRPGGAGMSVPLLGTDLAPGSHGEMGIDSKQGYVQVQATVHGLPSAATFGDEYMTYVLWAITPEGRATNLGELLVESADDSKARLEVTSELQAFGLVVTAEPHFGVTMPSNVVVMESGIPASGNSRVETVDAEYQLLERGTYSFRGQSRTGLEVPSVPFYVVQARNARRIAIDAGARQHAPDALARGEGQMRAAEVSSGKEGSASARQAAQTFEDARLISVDATRLAREAESKRTAERAQREASVARTDANVARVDASVARVDADVARADASDARRDADSAQDQAALAQAQVAGAEQATLQADRLRAASEAEKGALRVRLQQQLQAVFETRDTARGLIVNMSDVLFDFGKDLLKPEAREKLAKLAGVILSNAGLQVAIEGHADSIGGDAYNLALSRRRAYSVRAYLLSQALPDAGLTAQGFGEAQPVADNATAAGRSLNRRVEIVLSGDVIGRASLGD